MNTDGSVAPQHQDAFRSSIRFIRLGYYLAFSLIIATTLYSHQIIRGQYEVQENVGDLLILLGNISDRLQRSSQIVTLVLRSIDTDALSSRLIEKSGEELGELSRENQIDRQKLVGGIRSMFKGGDDPVSKNIVEDVEAFSNNLEDISQTLEHVTTLNKDQLLWRFSVWAPLQVQLGPNSDLVLAVDDMQSTLKSRNRDSLKTLSKKIAFVTFLTLSVLLFEIVVIFFPLLNKLIEKYVQINEQNKILSDSAKTDLLTGLKNRTGLKAYLEGLKAESCTHIDLLLIDIDNFKPLNDVYGHDTGDYSLRYVAARLLVQVETYGEVFRIGGDEFLAVMPCLQKELNIEKIAQCIVNEFRTPLEYNTKRLNTFVSIAISEITEEEITAQTSTQLLTAIIAKTSVVLRAAKNSGKNGIHRLTNEDIDEQVKIEKRIIKISQALCDGQFEPFFQPIIDIDSGTMIGSEALARWILPGGEIRYPNEFISIMEDNGLIDSLTESMLIKSYSRYKECMDQGVDMGFISVNFPESVLMQENMSSMLLELLDCSRLDWLKIEIVETALLNRSVEVILKNINEYIDLGARISLDDFGTGYASLSHLRDFPCHTIKIDRSFVSDTLIEDGNNQILNGMIEISKGLDMSIVIEGIETQKQYDYFKNWPAIAGQGYFMGKPMPWEELKQSRISNLKLAA